MPQSPAFTEFKGLYRAIVDKQSIDIDGERSMHKVVSTHEGLELFCGIEPEQEPEEYVFRIGDNEFWAGVIAFANLNETAGDHATQTRNYLTVDGEVVQNFIEEGVTITSKLDGQGVIELTDRITSIN